MVYVGKYTIHDRTCTFQSVPNGCQRVSIQHPLGFNWHPLGRCWSLNSHCLLMIFLFQRLVRTYNLMILKHVLRCFFRIIRSSWRNDGKRCNSLFNGTLQDDCVLSFLTFFVSLLSILFCLYSSVWVSCSYHQCQGHVSLRDCPSDRWSKPPLFSYGRDGHQPYSRGLYTYYKDSRH